MSKTKSFWVTLPGILTGTAAIITASGSLLFTLYEAGVIGSKPEPRPPFVLQPVDLDFDSDVDFDDLREFSDLCLRRCPVGWPLK